MIFRKAYLLLFLIIGMKSSAFGQSIIINEIMSSNNAIIQDSDGDFSDWIELYNIENFEVNLEGFELSDEYDEIEKWVFPHVNIPANGFLLVFASGKDTLQDGELHTNFKISQSGEELILSDANGQIISETEPIFIPTDYSFASILDGNSNRIITNTPTPEASNNISEGIYCSHSSGFYNNNFELELISINSNHKIYYTLNGEIPTVNSNLYNGEILIEDNPQNPYNISSIPTTPIEGPDRLNDYIWRYPNQVNRCNTIRFAAFENGILQGEIYTKSYFTNHDIDEDYQFPIVSIVTDSLNLFDYDTGIYIPGRRFEEEGFNWWPLGNYHNEGEEWERDIHLSYFENNGEIAFESNAGMRMRGFGSASNPQKSFNVYFRNEYGRSNIEYPIFDNSEAEKFKRLTFRNSGNDFLNTHFRDAMLQRVMSTLDLEIQDVQPANVFINGEYWGIHNIREKYDKHYFKYKYGLDEDEINILGVCGSIDEGENLDYLELLNFVDGNDLSIEQNYDSVSNQVDIANLIDFQIAEIYFANYDWPCNNYKIWKDNNLESKWRFLIYDLDLSFGLDGLSSDSTKSIEHATTISNDFPYCECSNLLFRKLLENDSFRDQFIARFAESLKNTFNIERINNIIDEFEQAFAPEIQEHIDRWSYPANIEAWENEIDKLRAFASKRPCYMASNITEYFNLTEFDFDCIKPNISEENNQDILLLPNPNSGNFSIYNNSEIDMSNGKAIIINSIGKTVFSKNYVSVAKNRQYYFQTNNLASGVYILFLEFENKLTSQKLIISH